MTEKTAAIPTQLPILPVREIVLFPGGIQPLTVGREGSLALLNSLHGDEKLLGIVAQDQIGQRAAVREHGQLQLVIGNHQGGDLLETGTLEEAGAGSLG